MASGLSRTDQITFCDEAKTWKRTETAQMPQVPNPNPYNLNPQLSTLNPKP